MVRSGEWVLVKKGEVTAKSEFQQKRLEHAVCVARVYLSGTTRIRDLARSLKVTPERAAQVVRLGVHWMERATWLHPVFLAPGPKPLGAPTPKRKTLRGLSGRGRG